MPYREDLDAALARAAIAEQELAEAREGSAHDHERIAALEKRLAEAEHGVHEVRKSAASPPPAPREEASPRRVWRLIALCVAIPAFFLGVLVIPWALRPKAVDVSAELSQARAEVRRDLPDAVLKSIRAEYVDPQGIAHLEYSGKVQYNFVSPSRAAMAAPETGAPIGVPSTSEVPSCSAQREYTTRRGVVTWKWPGRGAQCGGAIHDPPSCTVRDVWNEAIARGAPKNAVASIRLGASSPVPTWDFSISDATTTLFQMTLPDECPVPHPR